MNKYVCCVLFSVAALLIFSSCISNENNSISAEGFSDTSEFSSDTNLADKENDNNPNATNVEVQKDAVVGTLSWNNTVQLSGYANILNDDLFFGFYDPNRENLVFAKYNIKEETTQELIENTTYSYINTIDGRLFGSDTRNASDTLIFSEIDPYTGLTKNELIHTKSALSLFTIYDDEIYYLSDNLDGSGSIVKYSLATSETNTIVTGNISWFAFADGWLYFDDILEDSNKILVRCKLDSIDQTEYMPFHAEMYSVLIYRDKIYTYNNIDNADKKTIIQYTWDGDPSPVFTSHEDITMIKPFEDSFYFKDINNDLYRIKIGDSNSVKIANSVISFYTFQNYVFYTSTKNNNGADGLFFFLIDNLDEKKEIHSLIQ